MNRLIVTKKMQRSGKMSKDENSPNTVDKAEERSMILIISLSLYGIALAAGLLLAPLCWAAGSLPDDVYLPPFFAAIFLLIVASILMVTNVLSLTLRGHLKDIWPV